MSKGAVLAMTYSLATDYVKRGIRCNCIAPGRVHTAFVDSYLARDYPGKEKEMFQQLSEYQPIGRMGKPSEMASLVCAQIRPCSFVQLTPSFRSSRTGPLPVLR